MMIRQKVETSKGLLSGSTVKTIAVVSMVIDHVGSHIIRNWFAIPAVMLYDGTRGKQNKYFFYVFYPAHFMIIYAVMAFGLKITPEFFI